jgi:response regulator RpfG family c-di-GMP phosphodiesterase
MRLEGINMEDIRITKAILVVDDMPVNLTTIKGILLSNNEYELYSAKSGADALRVLEHNIIDLMLLDIEIPDMTGFELFAKIQKNALYSGVPIIFVTATAAPDIIKKATQMGAKDYVVKPVKAEILLKKVNSIFESGDIFKTTLIQKLTLLQEACKTTEIISAENIMTKIRPECYITFVSMNLKRIGMMLHNGKFREAAQKTREMIAFLQL